MNLGPFSHTDAHNADKTRALRHNHRLVAKAV